MECSLPPTCPTSPLCSANEPQDKPSCPTMSLLLEELKDVHSHRPAPRHLRTTPRARSEQVPTTPTTSPNGQGSALAAYNRYHTASPGASPHYPPPPIEWESSSRVLPPPPPPIDDPSLPKQLGGPVLPACANHHPSFQVPTNNRNTPETQTDIWQ
jgi:hypothetical protein